MKTMTRTTTPCVALVYAQELTSLARKLSGSFSEYLWNFNHYKNPGSISNLKSSYPSCDKWQPISTNLVPSQTTVLNSQSTVHWCWGSRLLLSPKESMHNKFLRMYSPKRDKDQSPCSSDVWVGWLLSLVIFFCNSIFDSRSASSARSSFTHG